jgi:thiopeptide-type bacteriocin biosynthesis protein
MKTRGVERVSAVNELRRSRGLPRFVLLAEADNQLLIDFDNVLSIETLVEYVKKRPSIRLVEMFPGPDALPARGPEGAFTHEIVVPFVREAQTKKSVVSASPATRSAGDTSVAPACVRKFLPGSRWLFVKIHAGPSHVDRLLPETIGPLVRTVLAEGEAEGWFFIRYADPQWHLRLRFRGDPAKLTSRVLPRLWECLEPHAAEGRIYSMSLDTYEREIERYGGLGGMETAERFFQTDSELALDLLTSIGERPGTKVRWQLAFYSVNLLMAGLGLDVLARRQTINTMGRFQEKKFDVSAQYRKQVSDHFRGERQTLEKLLDDPRAGDFPESAIAALDLYAERLKTIRQELERQQQAARLTVAIPELAGSYVHMHLNRLFRSAANAQEMVLYDYLARTYDSRMAREKRKVS